MEREMTGLTHEDQPLVGAIARRNIPTLGTRLTGMVGIDFDTHTAVQGSFVGNIAMQLGKSPLGDMTVRPSLLPAGFPAMGALGALTDVGQIFQPNETVWMLGDDAMLMAWFTACFNRLSRPLMTTSRLVAERVPFVCNRLVSLA